jgi:YidC/Oxa1 family membrane protein insertase
MQNDSKNMMLFAISVVVLLAVYQFFVLAPATKKREAEAKARAQAEAQAKRNVNAPPTVLTVPRAQALAASPRVAIDSPALQGSVALKGARIDDLVLKQYAQTLEPGSPRVELFRPEGAEHAYFAEFGWTGANLGGLPGSETSWTLASGPGALSPAHPVVLTFSSPQGLKFTRTISVDDKYMFTVADQVANQGGAPVTISPYATVQRRGLPADILTAINVHQGAVGWLGEDKPDLKMSNYKDWKKKGEINIASKGGWAAITDKYWMAALLPDQREKVRTAFRVTPVQNVDVYDASFLGEARTLAPGQQVSVQTRMFAGAKTVPLLQSYSKTLGVPELDRAVDWGRLWFLTRPIFGLLKIYSDHIPPPFNFGVALLLLTVSVRLLLFWPAHLSYASATKMKKIQPELDKLKQKHKDDPAAQQKAMMELWQREKINPMLGCLPMLATIPVFLSLFKVLSVTIEMRHAPFFTLVRDLSAPDPSTVWNLFGLIPWDPATLPVIGGMMAGGGFLHVGVWAITYAFTTWLSQSMTPTTGMDPTQQKMLQLMPWFFMFIMARFTVGLLIYYTWSNLLTVLQQYVIMRRFKVENPIDNLIARVRARAASTG